MPTNSAATPSLDKVFTAEVRQHTDPIVARYETKRASILEVLRFLMEKHSYITLEMEEATAHYLEIAPMDVREVVTFYTLFYTKPLAKTRFNVCRTLACSLLGAPKIIRYLEKKLNIKPGQMTPDGVFALNTVECLGACEMAPMMQVNDCEFAGHLTEEKIDNILAKAQKGSR